ncbi:MAG TPA: helix-turn-helix transcriptional regulator [Gaiellaceae bacterium]|jgi:DNA-binding PadR family transcriptional regulator
MKAFPPKGSLDALVLAALAAEPGHGYAIVRRLRARSDDVFRFSEGTVYPVLHRLEHEGLVRSRWTPARGRRRRVYRITPGGREALAVRRLEWQTFARAVEAVLAMPGKAADTHR